ncbi:hypothetical protein [Mesobacillus jeotgali]|uniref:hypothetical protein n=1 Tax=Mesobacillus jeotgali TaxID=129985 RepID=UPI0009A8CA2B|nr:hypothetical protein [Mesobacillus jeotgali]
MRMGLKPRLILAFISIIVLPIIVSVLFMFLFASGMEEQAGKSEDELDMLLSEVKNTIDRNAANLSEPELFYERVRPLLKKYDIELAVYSSEGESLFDSAEHQMRIDSSFFLSRLGKLKVDVSTKERGELSVEIQAKSFSVAPFTQFKEVILALVGGIATGLAVLAALIYCGRGIFQGRFSFL